MRLVFLTLLTLNLNLCLAQDGVVSHHKGGVTSGGGDHDPITECVERYTNVGMVSEYSEIRCPGLTREEKECIQKAVAFSMEIEEIINICGSLER